MIKLLDFIKNATSSYHVVDESIRILRTAGFKPLDFSMPWSLESGASYYTVPSSSSSTLFAFTLGENLPADSCFHLAAAHTDHPGFRIKPVAEMSEKNYLKINTQCYGGAILNTWLDRPLSIAGKIALKSDDIYKPIIRLVDLKSPLLTIPNLSIHMNREVNKGIELNKQTDILPLFAMKNDHINSSRYFMDFLASALEVDVSQILDFDLHIYNCEEGCLVGMNHEFISAPRLDNLSSVSAILEGITTCRNAKNINVIALYDNEEIGSKSRQGADSMLTNILLEKIYSTLGKTRIEFYDCIMKSMSISVDVAHALHPNYTSRNDPTNIIELGNGVVFKIDYNQKYAFDVEALAILEQLCECNGIKYQKFINRSDIAGGSTLGSITSSWLPMKTVDLGVSLLAMHSARELMGAEDQPRLSKLLKTFFEG